MNDRIETRTKLDVIFASLLGIWFGAIVAGLILGTIYTFTVGDDWDRQGELFPPVGYFVAFVVGVFAAFQGFLLLDLAKFLLKSLGFLVKESGDLLEKTALEATVKIKEGKRKAAEIDREADIRVGVKKEIKTEEDAYERAAEELEEETQNLSLIHI